MGGGYHGGAEQPLNASQLASVKAQRQLKEAHTDETVDVCVCKGGDEGEVNLSF